MMKKIFYTTLCLALVFTSCKKEPTTWSPDWKTPIVKGRLTIADILPNNSQLNTDNYGSLVYNDTLYSFRIDTLIKLPDTSLITKSAIAFPSVTLGPGANISNTGIDQLYDLGDISLKRVIIKEGTAFIEISSPWPGKTKADFIFTKVKDSNGDLFKRTYYLEAGTNSNPYIIRDTFDISNYDFDLTGTNGNLSNNLTADIIMSSNEDVGTFIVTNQDTVYMSLSFKGLTAKYAKGYFGHYDISDETTFKFPQLKKLSGQILLDSIRLGLSIKNGFDIIAQTKITKLEGENTETSNNIPLNFPLLNQFINLNPATGGVYDNSPSTYDININSQNSNIIPFIENLPDFLSFAYQININPYGNLGDGTDQFFNNSRINLMLDAELPLNISLSHFKLVDTLKIDIKPIDELNSGLIQLVYENSFPLSAKSQFYLLDKDFNVIDSIFGNAMIKNGVYDNINTLSTAVKGTVEFSLNPSQLSNLYKAKQIALAVTFNTDNMDFIKINLDDYFDFKILSDLNLKIKV